MLLGVLSFHPGYARGEGRILNLSFWTETSSRVRLGGLWEFYENQWLKPEDYSYPSDIYADVDSLWQSFRSSTTGELLGELPQASYVMQFKGLRPSPGGYVLRLQTEGEQTQLKIFPKYAPEAMLEAPLSASEAIAQSQSQGSKRLLSLPFAPKSLDEIWIVILNRQQSQKFHVPTLERL